jgi:UDP-2,4-diacetamido-2,4,6-trideoxy-beta-L-altropyranose hydrolase
MDVQSYEGNWGMTSGPVISVAFRADASISIGTGHIMRCLTLADTLTADGARCRFICREHPGHLIEYIRERGYPVHVLPAQTGSRVQTSDDCRGGPPHAHWLGEHWETDAEQTRSILREYRPDWLIVDHYALDARWERALRGSFGKLMVIDDLADRPHACDLLLDQNLGRKAEDYTMLVPESCERLIGPKFALLRPEFAALREYSLERRRKPELKRLLVTMGGVDQPNATGKVLEALRACPLPNGCQITVVMGATAPWLEEVRECARQMPYSTDVVVNVDDMARRMAESDFAIGAAGSTVWERCCLGLPSVVVVLADNQKAIASALQTEGIVCALDTADLKERLIAKWSIITNQEYLKRLSRNSASLVDGLGCNRVQNMLMKAGSANEVANE